MRKTVLLLYGWTFAMASVAVISRFVQPFNSNGDLRWDNAIILGVLFLLALAASVFVVYVLEILKFERDGRRLRVRMGGPPPRSRSADDEPSATDASGPKVGART